MTDSNLQISFILSSRNDCYQGDSVSRLVTTLEYLAATACDIDCIDRLEVIVTDWGSEKPLWEVLRLTQRAAERCRFVTVPPDLARDRQQDSPFPEVLANNSAIRRARAPWIARIDQDTLIGPGALSVLLDVAAGRLQSVSRPEQTYYFGGRRSVPLAFTQTRPGPLEARRFIDLFGRWLALEGRGRLPWYDMGSGVEMMSAEMWHRIRGYDEELLYWGFMGTDLARRLEVEHELVDLDRGAACDLFHMRHGSYRLRATPRRKNLRRLPRGLVVNASAWGLGDVDLEMHSPRQRAETSSASESARSLARFALAVAAEGITEIGLRAPRRVVSLLRA